MHSPYSPVLQEIQSKVVEKLGMGPKDGDEDSWKAGFNHVMLNRYEDGSVYIGKHNDTKHNKVISGLCFRNNMYRESDLVWIGDREFEPRS